MNDGMSKADQFDISETYAAQEQALRAVWDDPALDEYNDHELKKKR